MDELELGPVGPVEQAHQDIEHQHQHCDQHQGNVREELLTPGFGYVEGQHRHQEDVVGEYENGVALDPVQPEFLILLVVGSVVVKAPVLLVVVLVHPSEYVYRQNLAAHLDQEHEQNLADVGQRKQSVSRLLHAQPVCSCSVPHEDDQEEIEGEVLIKVL